jgi:hypothetical protein
MSSKTQTRRYFAQKNSTSAVTKVPQKISKIMRTKRYSLKICQVIFQRKKVRFPQIENCRVRKASEKRPQQYQAPMKTHTFW